MINAATIEDLPEITAILVRVHLSTLKLNDEHTHLFVIRRNCRLQGVIGYEEFAPDALIRAFATVSRRQGHGRRLLHYILGELYRRGFIAAYAVTHTIPDWLLALGFEEITLDMVPASLRSSSEFQEYDQRQHRRIFRIDREQMARYQ